MDQLQFGGPGSHVPTCHGSVTFAQKMDCPSWRGWIGLDQLFLVAVGLGVGRMCVCGKDMLDISKKKKIGRRWDRVVCLAGMPKLPRVAGFGGFDPPPECLAAWIAGPLRGQKHARAAKCGSRPRDGRTVRDALSLGL